MAWMLSLKVLFISTGVLFTALGLKVSVPLLLQFVSTHVPVMWNFCLLFFKPPYLFVLINGIIIYIAASSRFRHFATVDDQTEPAPPSKAPAYEMKSPPELPISEPPVVYEPREESLVVYEHREEPPVLEVKAVIVNGSVAVEDEVEKGIDDEIESTWTPLKRMDSMEIPLDHLSPMEKPLVSTRFGHRKPLQSSPEGGRPLGVAKPKRHETLENTWKAITEGRAMPLSRHVKKCDTWENRGNLGPPESTAVKKSETFKDRTNQGLPPMSGGKLRQEPSLGQDELNRRVEAFIRKFNEEMRLQRQQSLNQFMEMIDRGSHE